MMLNTIRKVNVTGPLLVLLLLVCIAVTIGAQSVEQYDVFELTFEGSAEGNPYIDNTLEANFSNGSKTVTVPGFYDGKGVYKIRFSPDLPGRWSYITQSNLDDLNNRTGDFRCIDPTGFNHGPVQVTNTYYLEYADGTPVYLVGTTAYQWTSVKQSIQEQTVKTLADAPFNKIRMCVFPKHYRYGNDTEPWLLPFEKNNDENDFTQPNYEFFQNFDRRVRQLMDMGIQADVILFHPYDVWGYCEMGKQMNEKYVRYMIARLSAYRNVWWSLANEWDVPKIKDAIDWEGIGTLLMQEDPHQRLRGIHNWYADESHFYDHTRPWITHVSTQTSYFFNAPKWRERYKKPLLFDEMRYEGDVESGWGNMSSQEMTSYFWKAALSGGYGTHGDTYQNDSDTETEVRWWAKGGTLVGQSVERIAFFKSILERAPVAEMIPRHISLSGKEIPDNIPDKHDGVLVEALNDNIYVLSKEAEYYLVYTEKSGRRIELELPKGKQYKVAIIDTWNMKILSEKTVEPGLFSFETEIPYTAIRIVSM